MSRNQRRRLERLEGLPENQPHAGLWEPVDPQAALPTDWWHPVTPDRPIVVHDLVEQYIAQLEQRTRKVTVDPELN